MSRPKLLFGDEYEVQCEDSESGKLPGWYRARYMTAHAREMGWTWEIDDKRFRREEVSIIDWRLPKPRGRPKDVAKRQHIISLALANPTLSMKRIAEHVGCSEPLVSSVFDKRREWDKMMLVDARREGGK